jgi:hypothetical protein
MSRKCTGLLFATVVPAALFTTPAHGWNNTGHMTAALLAYRQLAPASQAKVVAILKAAFDLPELPRFRQDLTAGMSPDLSPNDQDLYVVVKAATWPDIIRDELHPCHKKFHKPLWHYTNLPYVAPGDPTPLPPSPVPAPLGQEPKEILAALQLCLNDVKAKDTPAHLRAARLCFLLHLVGDIHQPLHCAMQVSNDKLKDGDEGGNLQLVRRRGHVEGQGVVLAIHTVFDDLLGREERLDRLKNEADVLEHDPKLQRSVLAPFLKQKAPTAWAKESLADAIEFAYLNGQLKTFRGKSVKAFHKEHLAASAVPLEPSDYEKNARPVAERRIVLAGHRLAELLSQIFPPEMKE